MNGERVRNMEAFAALCGVSRPTVSKYFNDPASVRPSIRARIEAALERHDYRPNVYAVNQNRRLTKNVGIVVPYLADPFFAEIARMLERRCIENGFSPMLYSAHGDPALEVELLDAIRALKPAGVLLAPLGRQSDARAVERFCRNVPTVLFDSEIAGMGDAFVGSDSDQMTGTMVEYLCRTGGPPAFLEMRHPVNPNANKRRRGYARAMERQGHAPVLIRTDGRGWGFERIGYEAGKRLVATAPLEHRTILCSNDRLAIGFLSAVFQSGLSVGIGPEKDIRVAGHDDHPFARFACPSLTTIAQDYEAISRRSAEILFALVEGGRDDAARTETLFDGTLVMRTSA